MDRADEERLMSMIDGTAQRTKKMAERIKVMAENMKVIVDKFDNTERVDEALQSTAKKPTDIQKQNAAAFIKMWMKQPDEASDVIQKLKDRERENARLLQRVHELRSALPHPCDGELYKDWTQDDFFRKVVEEFFEFYIAWSKWKYESSKKEFYADKIRAAHNRMMEEATDIIIAVTSFQEKTHCKAEQRAEYMRMINASNAKRDGGKRFKHD